MGRVSNARERLIESAISLIKNRSYSSVGVQEICKRAGVKKGSFYHFFPSKKELTLTSLEIIWRQFKEEFLKPVLEADIPFDKKLEMLAEKSYKAHLSSKKEEGYITGCPFGNIALEMSTQDEEIRVKVEEIFSEWIQYLKDTINKAVEKGELAEPINTEQVAKAIVAYTEGVSVICKTFNDPEAIKNLSSFIHHIPRCQTLKR